MSAFSNTEHYSLAEDILRRLGVNLRFNCGILIDCSRSMADEFGLDKHGQPVPTGVSQVQRMVNLYFTLAEQLDPNGIAQGGFFSKEAILGETIDLKNYEGWVDRNRLRAEQMLGTDMVAGFKMMLPTIAKEMGNDLLTELAHFADAAYHGKVPVEVITSQYPYQLALLTDGEPENVGAMESLLRAMSWAPIEVLIIYVSNQKAGLDVLKSLTHIPGRLTENVRLINLGKGGLLNTGDEFLLRAFASGLLTYRNQCVSHSMLTA